MKKHFGFLLLIGFAGILFAVPLPKYEPLPAPFSNNAVASVKSRGSLLLYSLMGMGPKKTWDSTSNSAYVLDPDTGKWAEVHSVPGTVGRLAASAAGAREHIFLFGGYVVDAQARGNHVARRQCVRTAHRPLVSRGGHAGSRGRFRGWRLSRPLHLSGERLVKDGCRT